MIVISAIVILTLICILSFVCFKICLKNNDSKFNKNNRNLEKQLQMMQQTINQINEKTNKHANVMFVNSKIRKDNNVCKRP